MKALIFGTLLILVSVCVQAKPVSIKVKGMVCAFCAQGIEKKFKAMGEVESVKVSLETKIVDLNFKADKNVPDDQIKKVITESGYEVVDIKRDK